jgi:hypothetical protein
MKPFFLIISLTFFCSTLLVFSCKKGTSGPPGLQKLAGGHTFHCTFRNTTSGQWGNITSSTSGSYIYSDTITIVNDSILHLKSNNGIIYKLEENTPSYVNYQYFDGQITIIYNIGYHPNSDSIYVSYFLQDQYESNSTSCVSY